MQVVVVVDREDATDVAFWQEHNSSVLDMAAGAKVQLLIFSSHVVFECPAVQPFCDKFAHLFYTPGQTILRFLWQEDMQSVVQFVQECRCILLPDNVAASAEDDSSNQP